MGALASPHPPATTNAADRQSQWHAVAAEVAVRFLPPRHRPRFREEWGAALDEISNAGLPAAIDALRIIAAAPRLGFALRRADERRRLAEQLALQSRRTAFIGYDHRNVRLAEELKTRLVRAAHRLYGTPNLTLLHSDYHTTELNEKFFSAFADEIANSRFYLHLASPESATSSNTRHMIEHWLSGNDPCNLVIVHLSGEIRWDADTNDFDWDSTTALPHWMSGMFETRPRLMALDDFNNRRAHAFVAGTLLQIKWS